jgi:hypothetical protein
MSDKAVAYETPFTEQAVLSLSDHIKASLTEYAKNNGKDGKVDFFVMMAALGQTAFEMAMSTLPKSQEDRKAIHDEMRLLTDNLLAKIDAVRVEYKTRGSTDLVAIAHLMSLVAEIYSRRRDAAVLKVLQDQAEAASQDAAQAQAES